jgi:nucleotide-binding universal stress UspA family protein
MFDLRRILVPVDFSECSMAALEYALFLSRRFQASVDLLHVWQPPRPVWTISYPYDVGHECLAIFEQTEAGRQMKEFLARAERETPRVRGRLESGDPYRTILEVAEGDGYDLLVMGTHGRTGMSHLLLGSLAEAVVRRAPCPVMTIRAHGHVPRPDETRAQGLVDDERAVPR